MDAEDYALVLDQVAASFAMRGDVSTARLVYDAAAFLARLDRVNQEIESRLLEKDPIHVSEGCGVIVISLFDYTGTMVKPWADVGFLCYTLDVQHPEGEHRDGNIVRVGEDVRDWLPPRGDIAACFAFPPCTDLAVSGARWFKGKGLGRLAQAIELFHRAARLCEWTGAPYLIENPVSTISGYWRKSDHAFDPCDYAGYQGGDGDLYTKRTCLWVGGGFRMPPPKRLDPAQGSRMHLLPPSAERTNLRSATPAGFARAVFESNCPAHLRRAAA